MLYAEKEVPDVLREVATRWKSAIEQSRRHKDQVWGQAARECYQYYAGPRSWDELMGKDGSAMSSGDMHFKMHVNKAFEYANVFGPYLYYANPVRTVKPRATFEVPPAFYPDAATWQAYLDQEQIRTMVDGVRAAVIEKYVNWTPGEFHLDVESRLSIGEALIKGRGCAWTEIEYLPNGTKAVVTRFGSSNFLFVDPDCDRFENAKWIARRCVKPSWEVEQHYGLRPNSLKGNLESQAVQGEINVHEDGQYDRARGLTNDLIIYYEIWSKMGIGGRLKQFDKKFREPLDEVFGDYSYVVVSPNVSFPLNMPPDVFTAPGQEAEQRIMDATKWPIPFHADGEWPVSVLDFAPLYNQAWPLPPLWAARGELRFMSWVMSFVAGHLRNSTRDFVAVAKSLPEEIKTAILSGDDLTILELEKDHGAITECIQFLQHPEVNGDIWQFLEAVERAFEKRTGLTDLLQGQQSSTQIRSASEANLRNENMSIRPDDMSQLVAAWQASIAAKEAGACRYFLTSEDILVPLGPMAASIWDTHVLTPDPTTAFKALEYRIEAGSTRKPNKEFQVRQMTEAMQTLGPVFQTYAQMTGDLGPLNALIADFCKSRDLSPERYTLTMAPQPSPLPAPGGANPSPDGEMHSPPLMATPQQKSQEQLQPGA